MIASLFALALLHNTAQTVTVEPLDDVWVYSHADDNKGEFLRVWGAEGKSVAPTAAEQEEFGYSYMHFKVNVPEGAEISGITLTVTHKEKPGFTNAISKQYPLEVRLLNGTFTEKDWSFDKATQVNPAQGKDGWLGEGSAESVPAEGIFPIKIDLTGQAAKAGKAIKDGKGDFYIALTSAMNVQELGQGCIYKFYSKDASDVAKHPVLAVTFKK